MTLDWSEPCEFDVDGLRCRVRLGKKHAAFGDHVDHVMEWLTPTGWVPVRFLTVGMMVDFLYWNEQGLYPPFRSDGSMSRYIGGEKLMRYLKQTVRENVHAAERTLTAEKAAKREREAS